MQANHINDIYADDFPIISVRQPWAWLIMHGGKDIENRDWTTKVRGRVYIHASKGITKAEWYGAWQWVKQNIPTAFEKGMAEIKAGAIERGGIIGSVEIVDCVSKSDSPWFMGEYGFVLRDPKPLPFHLYPGQLKFFKLKGMQCQSTK